MAGEVRLDEEALREHIETPGYVSGATGAAMAQALLDARGSEAALRAEVEALSRERDEARAEADIATTAHRQAIAALAAVEANEKRLREALGALSRQVEWHIEGCRTWLPDHACAECVPSSTIIKPGFRCGRHAALGGDHG